ncbi:MAG: DUF1080 domain-containing protein [Planctomycetota bacterium]|nr:DUF1080 domain-containing protein [Planctomycetota bacterium]
MMRRICTALLVTLTACAAPTAPWTELIDGGTAGWAATNFGGEGEVAIVDGAVEFDYGSPMTGLTWTGAPPSGDYDLEVTAARVEGTDFFCGLTFPVGDAFLTLVLGGWGGSLCGLSSLDGEDASSNESKRLFSFENGREYCVLLQVRSARVTVWIDDAVLMDVPIAGKRLSLRPEVELSRPLGIASFATRARVRSLRWRPAVGG